MKVKDIMSRDVIYIKPDENGKDALTLLFKHKISGLPVIDDKGDLVGMFTEKDVLKNILPSYIENVGAFVYTENPKSVKRKLDNLSNLKVSQLMRKGVITVREDASLCEVAHLMLTQNARRIPVLDDAKKVVGIVAREDIVKSYAKESGWAID